MILFSSIWSPSFSIFVFFLLFLPLPLPLFGQRPRREPEGTKSCRIQGESVCPSVLFRGSFEAGPGSSDASPGLSEARLGLSEVSSGLSKASYGLSEAIYGLPDASHGMVAGQRDGRMDGWDIQIPPVFYRTLSPTVPSGAAALLT